MGKATGMESQSAIKKASSWGAAALCGAGDGILIKGHGLKRSAELFIPDELGLSIPNDAVSGAVKCEGDISAYLRYDSLDLLIALAMGAVAGDPAQQGETSAYAQTFEIADSLDGLFATFCFMNNVNIDEYTSLKITGFTLKGEVGKPVEITFSSIAIDRATGSVINTLTTFDDVTFPEAANRVLFSQGVFRLNAKDGSALGGGDAINPSGLELSFKRKLEGANFVGGANTIDEPGNAGPAEIRLKLDFPRYASKTHFTDWAAGTAKKMDITFTGAVIEAPYARTLRIELPDLRYVEADMPVEPGILKHSVEFAAIGTEEAPAGMTSVKPFRISVVNKQSVNVLG